MNSPGLVFRGRTPRTASNPNGFEVEVVGSPRASSISGTSQSGGAGGRYSTSFSGGESGVTPPEVRPLPHPPTHAHPSTHPPTHPPNPPTHPQWQAHSAAEHDVVAPPRRISSLSASASSSSSSSSHYDDDKHNKKGGGATSKPSFRGGSAVKSLLLGACLTGVRPPTQPPTHPPSYLLPLNQLTNPPTHPPTGLLWHSLRLGILPPKKQHKDRPASASRHYECASRRVRSPTHPPTPT